MDNFNLSDLLTPLTKVIRQILINKGLKDSRLIENFTISFRDNDVIIELPNYAIFIDKGRKPNSKLPPVDVISRWIKMKSIIVPNGFTQNSFAFVIAKSIAKNGIRPRPFIDILKDSVFDIIFEYISLKTDNLLKELM
jgi:hypothetical protein